MEKHGISHVPSSTFHSVQFVRIAREMTERIHVYGAKIFLQMSGGFGRIAVATNLGEFQVLAPSLIPHRWEDKMCREITKEKMHYIVKQFGKGAYNAKRAGFDGIQIHAVQP